MVAKGFFRGCAREIKDLAIFPIGGTMDAPKTQGHRIMSQHTFPELGIAPELLEAVKSLGFEQPSPIQAQAIPVALTGRDVVGQSHTGSGKTMAFGIPVVQGVDGSKRHVQALILCPTR